MKIKWSVYWFFTFLPMFSLSLSLAVWNLQHQLWQFPSAATRLLCNCLNFYLNPNLPHELAEFTASSPQLSGLIPIMCIRVVNVWVKLPSGGSSQRHNCGWEMGIMQVSQVVKLQTGKMISLWTWFCAWHRRGTSTNCCHDAECTLSTQSCVLQY